MKTHPVLSLLPLMSFFIVGCQESHNIRMRWAASIPGDDQHVIGVDAGQQILLFERETQKVLRAVGVHKAGIRALRVHPEGTHVATLGNDGRCILWTLKGAGDNRVYRVAGAGESAGDVAFTADGRHLFVGGTGAVTMYALNTGQLVRVLPDRKQPELYVGSEFEKQQELWSDARVLALDAKPDSPRVLVGTDNGVFQLDYIHSEITWHVMTGEKDPAMLVRYTPDGEGIFISRRSGKLDYYTNGTRLQSFLPADTRGRASSGHRFTAVEFNRNGSWLAMLGTDGIFRVIKRSDNRKTWEVAHRAAPGKPDVNGIALADDGHDAWVGSQGNVERFTRLTLPEQLWATAARLP